MKYRNISTALISQDTDISKNMVPISILVLGKQTEWLTTNQNS